jgi:hypothetical protein
MKDSIKLIIGTAACRAHQTQSTPQAHILPTSHSMKANTAALFGQAVHGLRRFLTLTALAGLVSIGLPQPAAADTIVSPTWQLGHFSGTTSLSVSDTTENGVRTVIATLIYEICKAPLTKGQKGKDFPALSHFTFKVDDCVKDGVPIAAFISNSPITAEDGYVTGPNTIVPVVPVPAYQFDPSTGAVGYKIDVPAGLNGSCYYIAVTFEIAGLSQNKYLSLGEISLSQIVQGIEGAVAVIKAGTKSIAEPGPVYGIVCLDRTVTATGCHKGETAWSDGFRYSAQGNWATVTAFAGAGSYIEVPLLAGQTYLAGNVRIEDIGGGEVKITITLASGYLLSGGVDAVKVQPYYTDGQPTGNPVPGQFEYKTDQLELIVPLAKWYGIHVDVLRPIECPPAP